MEELVRAMPTAANLAAFRDAKVFITGHTGFKGSWLSLWLSQLGAHVTGYALPPTSRDSHFTALSLDQKIHHIEADIREAERLYQAIDAAKPDFVFHLAAQALVRWSYSDPLATFGTNVYGSACLLDAVRRVDGIKALIYVTSDKCYLNKEWAWAYRETDEIGGHDPYSASKAAAENVYRGYVDSFLADKLGSATVRAGNVIGGGDWAPDRLVPDCIRWLMEGKPITLRHPRATRPWQFVLDPLGGYLMLALRLAEQPKKFAGAWNFGPDTNNVRTVDQITHRIVDRWGSGRVEYVKVPATGQPEAMLLQLSIEKAAHELRWRPVYDPDIAVDSTVSWYRAWNDKGDIPSFSRRQIEQFMEAAAAR